MSLYKRFETSKKLATEGAPLHFPKNDNGTVPTLFIARAHSSNQLHAAAVKDVYTPEVIKGLENMPDDDVAQMTIEVFLRGSLMGWENIEDRDGAPLEFSKENARQFFTDLPEVFEIAQRFATNLSNYLKVAEDNAVKNW